MIFLFLLRIDGTRGKLKPSYLINTYRLRQKTKFLLRYLDFSRSRSLALWECFSNEAYAECAELLCTYIKDSNFVFVKLQKKTFASLFFPSTSVRLLVCEWREDESRKRHLCYTKMCSSILSLDCFIPTWNTENFPMIFAPALLCSSNSIKKSNRVYLCLLAFVFSCLLDERWWFDRMVALSSMH